MEKKYYYPLRDPKNPYNVEKIPITEDFYNEIYPIICYGRAMLLAISVLIIPLGIT